MHSALARAGGTSVPSPCVSVCRMDASSGLWMATSSNQASLAGNDFGRLAMANGMLSFEATKFEWRLALADVKRIAPSKLVSNTLEVESVTGQVYFVAILDGQLTMTSPGKAAQLIQRAVKTAPAIVTPAHRGGRGRRRRRPALRSSALA